ncbi:MAG: response regulator transcription factor [Bacteroidia bacterium]|nr:response regulator transcription factor [Bacteroidia bacterium]
MSSEISEISFIIADNEPFTRKGIIQVLSQEISGGNFYEVSNGQTLIKKSKELKKPFIIVDYSNLEGFTIDKLKTIYASNKIAKILIISNSDNKEEMIKVLDYGVKNYILRTADDIELKKAVKATLENKRFLCGKVIDAFIDNKFSKETKKVNNRTTLLTEKETEILKLIAQGNTNQRIANRLGSSIHTINTHRKNIFKKLGFKKASEAIIYAIENGIASRT